MLMRVFDGLSRPATAAAVATHGQRRGFYDKIRKEREGSDPGPEELFVDFPRNPNPQRVPKSLHKSKKGAVDTAESINIAFLVSLFVLMGVLGYFLDPFNGDQYERPNKRVPVLQSTEKVPPAWASKG